MQNLVITGLFSALFGAVMGGAYVAGNNGPKGPGYYSHEGVELSAPQAAQKRIAGEQVLRCKFQDLVVTKRFVKFQDRGGL